MQLLQVKYVPIAQLNFPGHWRQILNDPSIPTRAMSFKLVGQLHEPMVRKSDWLVIHGLRRIAAHIHNGESDVLVKLVECTDAEVELIRKIENAHREHMTREELAKLVDLIAKQLIAFEPQGCAPPPTRRMKLPKTAAREIVADVLGITPAAVKKTLQREKYRKNRLRAHTRHDDDLGIRSPWATLDDEFRSQTNRVVAMTSNTAQLLQKAMQQLTWLLQTSGLPLHVGRLTKTYEDIAVSAASLRALLPTSLCPYCKGVALLQPKCAGCMTSGYITRNQEEGVPEELWREESPLVMSQGKLLPLSEFEEAA